MNLYLKTILVILYLFIKNNSCCQNLDTFYFENQYVPLVEHRQDFKIKDLEFDFCFINKLSIKQVKSIEKDFCEVSVYAYFSKKSYTVDSFSMFLVCKEEKYLLNKVDRFAICFEMLNIQFGDLARKYYATQPDIPLVIFYFNQSKLNLLNRFQSKQKKE